MAYEPALADEMREALRAMLGDQSGLLTERRMFGGVCFMARGNMIGGASRTAEGQRRMMFRVGKDNPSAEDLPGGEPMMMGDRLMRGFWFLDADASDHALRRRWLRTALDFAMSLPPK